jgi:hypothetical protein
MKTFGAVFVVLRGLASDRLLSQLTKLIDWTFLARPPSPLLFVFPFSVVATTASLTFT